MEIELKLLIAPDAVRAFKRHPLLKTLAITKPYQQQLVSTYFDTPDCYLMQHRAGLRVREVGGKLIQTLKAGGQVEGGLHQRNEWESEVRALTPDLAAIQTMLKPASKWSRLLERPALNQQLIPVFTTRFQRHIWLLRLPEGDEVELALDQGEIESGHGDKASRLPISEIELELKSGKAGNLFALALALQETVSLSTGNISKAERGYRLYAPQAASISKAGALDLTDKKTLAQGFQAIVGDCLRQIQDNESGVKFGTDAESVHQMRIGVRRLRSALAIFSHKSAALPLFLKAECQWLGHHLGAARDWEVFAGSTLAAAFDVRGPQTIAPLQKTAHDFAKKSRADAIKVLNSARYTRLILTLGACIHSANQTVDAGPDRDASSPAPGQARLRPFVAAQLARYQKKLLKRGEGLDVIDSAERHQLRIAAKKMRYGLAFFSSLYPAKKIKPYLGALSTLQDTLGDLNDARVAETLLQHCAVGRPQLTEVSGYVRSVVSLQSEGNLKKLNKQWKKFKRTNAPF
ncbi:CYTH and CHAD domain-containing protein [Glaciimonas sp. PAMC28666]|uniref:CYTH and CHAD domain-containing protein n=1 Tax=Glaciimonas sp. PAMC28666 TaxID=2807626 RepID=UPI001966937B|nr:CYTH and CHAD domain-containing protein [Glaciimonas sp. PAMC28666]QRX82750.1 CYTH and CHAD domain-containing protein [Glaciimonas sp. PAMC28666]